MRRCRLRRSRRNAAEQAKGFLVQLAGDLQTVADLKAPNRGSRIRIFLACDFSVIKTLLFQRLLHALDALVRANRSNGNNQNQNGDFNPHLDVDSFDAAMELLFGAFRRSAGERRLALF